jgi:hypothetical protein
MGKLKNLATISTSKPETFVYTPPASAYEALRILVKVNLNKTTYVNNYILDSVLRGLRRVNTLARIVVIDSFESEESAQQTFHQCGVDELLDQEMRAAAAEIITPFIFQNINPEPLIFGEVNAPKYIYDYDCCISVSGFKPDEPFTGGLHNLVNLIPKDHAQTLSDALLTDIYFTIGHHFDGSVLAVDHANQVIWGDDMIAVDESAYRTAGREIAPYLSMIRDIKKRVSDHG